MSQRRRLPNFPKKLQPGPPKKIDSIAGIRGGHLGRSISSILGSTPEHPAIMDSAKPPKVMAHFFLCGFESSLQILNAAGLAYENITCRVGLQWDCKVRSCSALRATVVTIGKKKIEQKRWCGARALRLVVLHCHNQNVAAQISLSKMALCILDIHGSVWIFIRFRNPCR